MLSCHLRVMLPTSGFEFRLIGLWKTFDLQQKRYIKGALKINFPFFNHGERGDTHGEKVIKPIWEPPCSPWLFRSVNRELKFSRALTAVKWHLDGSESNFAEVCTPMQVYKIPEKFFSQQKHRSRTKCLHYLAALNTEPNSLNSNNKLLRFINSDRRPRTAWL